MEKTFEEGSSQSVHNVGTGRDGNPTHYLALTAPYLRNEDRITHVIHMSLDTTELHELETRLHQADAMREAVMGSSLDAIVVLDAQRRIQLVNPAAERLASVGQTVAGLAHGIKNILTGLEGGMYVTSSGLKKRDDARVRQGWEMLQRNISRISGLAKDLLAFSRGDHSHPELIDPRQVIHDVVELYRESACQHGVTLKEEIQQGVEKAWLEPDGLHTCLANLVSIAMDACMVSRNRDCTIRVRLREENGSIFVEVADTGCGMDYELKQKVFTSFLSTKGKGGTGIGLLITRKIVQQHGGEVTVFSEPGEGSTFRLEFPRRRLPRPAPEGRS